MKTWTAVAAAVLMGVGYAGAETLPMMKARFLAVPPAQERPWTPPASRIDPEAVEAMAKLFDQGLADPRGCEYREIGIVTGNCWGFYGLKKTRGWVLPGAQDFAVAWNGLVYPVVSVGAPGNLRMDVERALRADEMALEKRRLAEAEFEKRRKETAKDGGRKFDPTTRPLLRNLGWTTPEEVGAGVEVVLPLRAALLLRLGEAELAEQVWESWNSGVQKQHEPTYLSLAHEWVWAAFNRALGAHMRGDDHLALSDAEQLSRLGPLVEAEAGARGAARFLHDGDTRTPGPYLPYLQIVPALVEDQRRRAREGKRTPLLEQADTPGGAERVAGLIRDLEFVSARQMSQPGGVNLGSDSIVEALVREGDAAVPPLLECLENDTRLTRSVRFWRDFDTRRTVLGVHEAAYVALARILQTRFFASSSTSDSLTARGLEGRRDVVGQIRKYWEANRDMPMEERWYRTLANEESSAGQVLEAVGNIVRPVNVTVLRNSMFESTQTIPAQKPGEVPGLAGESLRAKRNPDVGELLAKRAQGKGNLEFRVAMGIALAQWDGRSHQAVLQGLWEDLQEAGINSQDREQRRSDILRVAEARVKVGDNEALRDYGAWLELLAWGDLDFQARKVFTLMWKHPDDPAMLDAAERLFGGEDGPLQSMVGRKGAFVRELAGTPMVALPVFRRVVRKGLADHSPAGTVTITPDGQVSVKVDGGSSSSGGRWVEDPLAPEAGQPVPFRTCDLFALEISSLEGAPKMQLYWPAEKRDEAVSACAVFLDRFGGHFRHQPGDSEDYSPYKAVPIHFPRLETPATMEDVAEGRAIFALDGARRVWSLPEFPLEAAWTTLRDSPMVGVSFNSETGREMRSIHYQTEGRVFQAEEVLEGGVWKRYYGFVGQNRMAKVPAGEIEFPIGYPGLMAGWSFRLAGDIVQFGDLSLAKMNGLSVTLSARNGRGIDQPPPAGIAQGVTFKFQYSPKTAFGVHGFHELAWEDALVEPMVTVSPIDQKSFAPLEERGIAVLDLGKMPGLKPGSYRVSVEVRLSETETARTPELFFTVSQ